MDTDVLPPEDTAPPEQKASYDLFARYSSPEVMAHPQGGDEGNRQYAAWATSQYEKEMQARGHVPRPEDVQTFQRVIEQHARIRQAMRFKDLYAKDWASHRIVEGLKYTPFLPSPEPFDQKAFGEMRQRLQQGQAGEEDYQLLGRQLYQEEEQREGGKLRSFNDWAGRITKGVGEFVGLRGAGLIPQALGKGATGLAATAAVGGAVQTAATLPSAVVGDVQARITSGEEPLAAWMKAATSHFVTNTLMQGLGPLGNARGLSFVNRVGTALATMQVNDELQHRLALTPHASALVRMLHGTPQERAEAAVEFLGQAGATGLLESLHSVPELMKQRGQRLTPEQHAQMTAEAILQQAAEPKPAPGEPPPPGQAAPGGKPAAPVGETIHIDPLEKPARGAPTEEHVQHVRERARRIEDLKTAVDAAAVQGLEAVYVDAQGKSTPLSRALFDADGTFHGNRIFNEGGRIEFRQPTSKSTGPKESAAERKRRARKKIFGEEGEEGEEPAAEPAAEESAQEPTEEPSTGRGAPSNQEESPNAESQPASQDAADARSQPAVSAPTETASAAPSQNGQPAAGGSGAAAQDRSSSRVPDFGQFPPIPGQQALQDWFQKRGLRPPAETGGTGDAAGTETGAAQGPQSGAEGSAEPPAPAAVSGDVKPAEPSTVRAHSSSEHGLSDAARGHLLPPMIKDAEAYLSSIGPGPAAPEPGKVRLYAPVESGNWVPRTFKGERNLYTAISASRGPSRHLFYVDVPEAEAAKHQQSGPNEYGVDAGPSTYLLPREWQDQAQPWGKPAEKFTFKNAPESPTVRAHSSKPEAAPKSNGLLKQPAENLPRLSGLKKQVAALSRQLGYPTDKIESSLAKILRDQGPQEAEAFLRRRIKTLHQEMDEPHGDETSDEERRVEESAHLESTPYHQLPEEVRALIEQRVAERYGDNLAESIKDKASMRETGRVAYLVAEGEKAGSGRQNVQDLIEASRRGLKKPVPKKEQKKGWRDTEEEEDDEVFDPESKRNDEAVFRNRQENPYLSGKATKKDVSRVTSNGNTPQRDVGQDAVKASRDALIKYGFGAEDIDHFEKEQEASFRRGSDWYGDLHSELNMMEQGTDERNPEIGNEKQMMVDHLRKVAAVREHVPDPWDQPDTRSHASNRPGGFDPHREFKSKLAQWVRDFLADEGGHLDLNALRDKAEEYYGYAKHFLRYSREALKRLAGQMVPTITRHSQRAGEAVADMVGGPAFVRIAAEHYTDKVLGKDWTPEFARKVGAVMMESRVRYAHQNLLQHGKLDEANKIKSFVGATNSPFQTEAEFRQALSDPQVKDALQRYRDHFVPEMEANFRKSQGMDETDPIQSLTQIPGHPINFLRLEQGQTLTDGSAIAGGAPGNFKNNRLRKNPFAYQASLSAGAYEMDLSKIIENSMVKGVANATKAEAFRALEAEGLGKWERKGAQLEGWKEVSDTNPPPGTQTNAPGEHRFFVKDEAYGELRNVLKMDAVEDYQKVMAYALDLPTRAALASGVEMAVHSVNLASALATSHFKPGDLLHNTYQRIMDKPAFRERLLELARINAVKPEGLESGTLLGQRLKKYDPTYYAGQLLHGLDEIIRMTLSDGFDHLVKLKAVENTATNKRDFINQAVGQYHKSAQNGLVRWLRNTKIGTFATAGTTFAVQSVKSLGLGTNLKATGAKADLALRAETLAKLAVVIGGSLVLNYALWGHPLGDDQTPFLAIKVGEDKKTGRTTSFDLTPLVKVKRGLRMLGALSQIEDWRRGKEGGQVDDHSVDSVIHSWTHPAMGPGPQFLWTAATGKNSQGWQVAPKVSTARTARGRARAEARGQPEEGSSQHVENLKAALKTANPIISALSGADRPGEDPPWDERAAKLLGPLGPKHIYEPPIRPKSRGLR